MNENRKKYFRVKYGHGLLDQVSIEEKDLVRAVYAQTKGLPVQLGDAYVNGKYIISITPHYHRYTGWNDTYEPKTAEDMAQIKRDCPSFEGVLEGVREEVKAMILSGRNLSTHQLDRPRA